MRIEQLSMGRALVLVASAVLVATSGMAEKPQWKQGSGHEKGLSQEETRREDVRPRHGMVRPADRQRRNEEVRLGGYFRDEQRALIRDYYGREYGAGKRCPPGLAKKHNGCLPPGQARKWVLGRVLPREVIYYAVPPAVLAQLGPPPAGHKFVRVAGDILLIAMGTGLVIDAIEDLGRQ